MFEAGTVGAYALVGVDKAPALAIALVVHSVQILIPAILGVIALIIPVTAGNFDLKKATRIRQKRGTAAMRILIFLTYCHLIVLVCPLYCQRLAEGLGIRSRSSRTDLSFKSVLDLLEEKEKFRIVRVPVMARVSKES